MPGPSVGPKLFRNEKKKLFGPNQKRIHTTKRILLLSIWVQCTWKDVLVQSTKIWESSKPFGPVPKCFGPKKDPGKNVFYSIYADWTVGDRKSQFLGEGLMFSYILFWGQARITCTTYTLVTVYYVSNKYVHTRCPSSFLFYTLH